jgi:hypothetical protein
LKKKHLTTLLLDWGNFRHFGQLTVDNFPVFSLKNNVLGEIRKIEHGPDFIVWANFLIYFFNCLVTPIIHTVALLADE